MNFEWLEASTGELHVSENSVASSKQAGWVRLTPYLTLKNHVSKHTQLRNVNVIMPHHNQICHMHPLTLGGDGSMNNFDLYSSGGWWLVEKNALYFSVVKIFTRTLRHQKNMH